MLHCQVRMLAGVRVVLVVLVHVATVLCAVDDVRTRW